MRKTRQASVDLSSGYFEVHALIFDCDGVLLESAEAKTQAFADLFSDYPQKVDAIVALHEREGGLSRYTKFDMIFEDILGLPLDHDHRRKLGRRYSELVVDEVLASEIVAGAEPLLERLAQLDVPAFVSSGSPHDELVLALEHHGLRPYFEKVWGHPTTKPEAIDQVLGLTGVDSKTVTFVGDAWSDYEAARSRGLRFLGRVPPENSNPFPTHIVVGEDLVELADHILGGEQR